MTCDLTFGTNHDVSRFTDDSIDFARRMLERAGVKVDDAQTQPVQFDESAPWAGERAALMRPGR